MFSQVIEWSIQEVIFPGNFIDFSGKILMVVGVICGRDDNNIMMINSKFIRNQAATGGVLYMVTSVSLLVNEFFNEFSGGNTEFL